MARISQLPAANPLTGAEKVPLVQNGATVQADYAELAGPVVQQAQDASATAVAIGNYRATFAAAIADFAVDTLFTCDEEDGELRSYRRIADAPFYEDLGEEAAPLTLARAKRRDFPIPEDFRSLVVTNDLGAGEFDDWSASIQAWADAGRINRSIIMAKGTFDVSQEIFIGDVDSAFGVRGIEGRPIFRLNAQGQRGINLVGLNNADRSNFRFRVETKAGIIAQWGVLQGRTYFGNVARSGGNADIEIAVVGAFQAAAYYNVQSESNRIMPACLFDNSVGPPAFWSKTDWYKNKFRGNLSASVGTPYLGEVFSNGAGASAYLLRLGHNWSRGLFHAIAGEFQTGDTITGAWSGAQFTFTRGADYALIGPANPSRTLAEVSTSTFQLIEAGAQMVYRGGDGLHAVLETNHMSDVVSMGANLTAALPAGGFDPNGILEWRFMDMLTNIPLNSGGAQSPASSGITISAPYHHAAHGTSVRLFDGYSRISQAMNQINIVQPLNAGNAARARVEALSVPAVPEAGLAAVQPIMQGVEIDVAGAVRLNNCRLIGNNTIRQHGPYAGDPPLVFETSGEVRGIHYGPSGMTFNVTTGDNLNRMSYVDIDNGLTNFTQAGTVTGSALVGGVLSINRKVTLLNFSGDISKIQTPRPINGDYIWLFAIGTGVTPKLVLDGTVNPAANSIVGPNGQKILIDRYEGVCLMWVKAFGVWVVVGARRLTGLESNAGLAAYAAPVAGAAYDQAQMQAVMNHLAAIDSRLRAGGLVKA